MAGMGIDDIAKLIVVVALILLLAYFILTQLVPYKETFLRLFNVG